MTGQSRRQSILEAITNTVVGYVVAVSAQLVVFPLFGVSSSLKQNLGIGLVMTVVSFTRSYFLRRFFNCFFKGGSHED